MNFISPYQLSVAIKELQDRDLKCPHPMILHDILEKWDDILDGLQLIESQGPDWDGTMDEDLSENILWAVYDYYSVDVAYPHKDATLAEFSAWMENFQRHATEAGWEILGPVMA